MKKVYIQGSRQVYDVNDITHTMTLDEMIQELEYLKESVSGDTKVYFTNKGYTFGSVTRYDFEIIDEDEEDDNEYEDDGDRIINLLMKTLGG